MEWSFLAEVGPEVRQRVLSSCSRQKFAAGENVFWVGDVGHCLYLVEKGRFSIGRYSESGKLVNFVIQRAGDVFGENALVNADSVRTASVEAIEDSVALVLDRHAFDALRRDHPVVDRVLVTILADQVARMTDQLVEALHLPAPKRVYRRVLMLHELYDADPIPVSQDRLAHMAGTTRGVVNRALLAATEIGALATRRGEIAVLDEAALQDLAN